MTAADLVRAKAKPYRDDAHELKRLGENRAELFRAFADELDKLADRIDEEAL